MTVVRLEVIQRDPTNSQAGFLAILRVSAFNDIRASLPAMPDDLRTSLENWQAAYLEQDEVRSYRIQAGAVSRHSKEDIKLLAEQLIDRFNRWLSPQDETWRKVREHLIDFHPKRSDEELRLILDLTEQPELKRLPWQEWNLLTDRRHPAEVALRAASSKHDLDKPIYPTSPKIRILVVVGETSGINAEGDLSILQEIERANPKTVEVHLFLQPTPSQFQAALDDPIGYHIFVFIGHSRSHRNGKIGWLKLSDAEHGEFQIDAFSEAMEGAIRRGLQLAILNSCDGLGLAQEFAHLGLSRCVVMKEPVPDEVAIEFLKYFFDEFTIKGHTLLTSVRIARQRLKPFDSRYSKVGWLPVVCLKPNAEPLTWKLLLHHLQADTLGQKLRYWSTGTTATGKRVRTVGMLMLAGSLLFGAARSVFPNALCPALPIPGCPPHDRTSALPPQTDLIPTEQLISAGGNETMYASIQLDGSYQVWKAEGIRAFAQGDYEAAIVWFDQIRTTAAANREDAAAQRALKDPEVLIYRNNAIVRQREQVGESVYTIAAAVPLSDRAGNDIFSPSAGDASVGAVGQQMLFGIAQMQDQVVNPDDGQPVVNLEVVIANDLNVPDQAAHIANALTQWRFNPGPNQRQRQILAVIGHYISASTCAALPIYSAARLVVISPASSKTDLREDCGDAENHFFFRTTSSAQIEAETLRDYLFEQVAQTRIRMALFYNPQDSFSTDIAKQFMAAFGSRGEFLEFSLADAAFNAEQALQAARDVDALVLLPDGRARDPEAFNRSLQILRLNAGEKLVLGSNPLYIADTIEQGGGRLLAGTLILAADWHPACDTVSRPGRPSFVKTAEELWFGGVNRSASLAYEAVQVLIPALTSGVSSPQIQAFLESPDQSISSDVYSSPAKTISFDPETGDRQELQLRTLITPSDSPEVSFALVPGTTCR